jgi:hypothetical protein
MDRLQRQVKQEPAAEIRFLYQTIGNLNLTSFQAPPRVGKAMKNRRTTFGGRSDNARLAVCTTPVLGILITNILLLRSRTAG